MNHSLSEFRDIVVLLFRVVRNDAYQSHDLNMLVNKIHDVLASVEESTPVYLPICEPRSPIEFQDASTPPTLVIHPDQDVGEIVPNVVVTKEEPDFRNLVVNLPAVVKAVKMEPAAPTPTPMVSPVTVALPGPPSLMGTTYKLDSDVAILKDLARDDSEAEVEESEDEGEVMIEDADIADDTDEEEPDVEDEEVEDEDAEEAEEEEETEEAEEEEETEEAEEAEEAEDEEAEEEEEDDDLELLKIKKQRYYWSPSSKRIYEFLEEGYGDCLGTYVDGKIIPKA